MLIAGCTVDNFVAGGPADLAKDLEKGDRILKVDGRLVEETEVRIAGQPEHELSCCAITECSRAGCSGLDWKR
jgi:C-terminal processing protease CtpA/Prc